MSIRAESARVLLSTGLALCMLLSAFVRVYARAEETSSRPAEESPGAIDRGAFDRLAGYLMAGTGRWRRDNPDSKQGADMPVAWIRSHAWTAGHDVVSAPVVALYGDGRCEPLVHLIFRWIPAEKTIESMSLGPGGVAMRGYVELLASGAYRVTGGGELPQGKRIRFRDTMDVSDSKVLRSLPESWDEGQWKPGTAASWRRLDGPDPCR